MQLDYCLMVLEVCERRLKFAPMGNKQVLLGFNRDPQKVQQYTCNSNENKMADASGGPARVMGLMAMTLTR